MQVPYDSLASLDQILNKIDNAKFSHNSILNKALQAESKIQNKISEVKVNGASVSHGTSATSNETQLSLEDKAKGEKCVENINDHPLDWFQYTDPASGKAYYHNYKLNKTQWDKPIGFVPIMDKSGLAVNTTNVVQEQFKAVASFNRSDGRFTSSGSDSYWDKVT